MIDIFSTQKSLQDEGHDFLNHTKLLEVLKDYGELLVEGSYAYGTMVDRDIDIRVILADGEPSVEYRNRVVNRILQIPELRKLDMVDMANYFWSKNQKAVGIWLGPQIMFNNELWNVDIWLFDYNNGHKHLDTYNRMMNVSDEDRQIILAIKSYCLENGLKQKGSTSIDIYRAVLEDGIKTSDDYATSRGLS